MEEPQRNNIDDICALFSSITLDNIKDKSLQNRVDSKFIVSETELPLILIQLKEDYNILEIDNARIMQYDNLHFDTIDFQFYHQHQNTKLNRHKVRKRTYIISGISYLEVKLKSNKGNTVKNRIRTKNRSETLESNEKTFTSNHLQNQLKLEAKLNSSFKRITLVSKHSKERATIDCDLNFDWNEQSNRLNNACIIEIKQERLNRNSKFYSTLKDLGHRPGNFSKYCIGCSKLYPELKNNNFKENLIALDRLGNA